MFSMTIDNFGVWLTRSIQGAPPQEVQMNWYYYSAAMRAVRQHGNAIRLV